MVVSQESHLDCCFFYVLFIDLDYFLSMYEGSDALDVQSSQAVFSCKGFCSTKRISRASSYSWFPGQSSTSPGTFSTFILSAMFPSICTIFLKIVAERSTPLLLQEHGASNIQRTEISYYQ